MYFPYFSRKTARKLEKKISKFGFILKFTATPLVYSTWPYYYTYSKSFKILHAYWFLTKRQKSYHAAFSRKIEKLKIVRCSCAPLSPSGITISWLRWFAFGITTPKSWFCMTFYRTYFRVVLIPSLYLPFLPSFFGHIFTNNTFVVKVRYNKYDSTNMWLLPRKRLLVLKIFFLFFFFLSGKNLFLHLVMMKKVVDRGFLAFWPLKSEWKFRRKCKNTVENQKFSKKWVSTTTGVCTKPWNVRTYQHHTNYYTDHQYPIINTNCLVIHYCDFYLFLNRTVLFICFTTNLSSLQKLSLFRTLRNYNFISEYDCEHEMAPCLRIIIITW